MADETRQLAQFIVDLRAADLRAELRERMRYLVLDSLASAYLGSRKSSYRIALRVVTKLAGRGAAHVFGYEEGLDVARASFLNGVAIGAFETEHSTTGAHSGGAVLPAILALGDALGSSGSLVMTALVAGYEANVRVAAAQTYAAEEVRGFHGPGISGPFGSAAGCSVLLGLSLEQTLSALGIAGSHSAGLSEYRSSGAMTKRIHLGRAAQSGIESALLASAGLTGPPTILEGDYGYLQAYSPEPATERLTEGLGARWLMEQIRIKPFPACRVAQPFIAAIGAWRSQGVDPRRIETILVKTSKQGREDRYRQPSANSVLDAQYSLPFMISVVLARGIDGVIDLDEEGLTDPFLHRLAARVTIEEDARFLGPVIDSGGEVTVVLDGSSESVSVPGIAPNSLQEMRGLVRSKLERYAQGLLDSERIAKIEETVDFLEELSDIGQLTRLVF